MSGIELFYFPVSPPTRSVMLLGKFLGLVFNLKLVDIMAGQQMQPDFLKMNPMHTVPMINDNGFILWESKAIMQYLIDTRAEGDNLKPSDPKSAALVNQRLHFDSTLSNTMRDYIFPVMLGLEKPNSEKKAKCEEALKALDFLLENKKWAAGNRMSIADFALVSTVDTMEAVGFDISKYPNVIAWFNLCKKEMSGYDDIGAKGAAMFGTAFSEKVKSYS